MRFSQAVSFSWRRRRHRHNDPIPMFVLNPHRIQWICERLEQ